MAIKLLLGLLGAVLVMSSAQANHWPDIVNNLKTRQPVLTVYNALPEYVVHVTEGLLQFEHKVLPKSTLRLKDRTGKLCLLKLEVEDDLGVMHRVKHCPTCSKHDLHLEVGSRPHHPGQYFCKTH